MAARVSVLTTVLIGVGGVVAGGVVAQLATRDSADAPSSTAEASPSSVVDGDGLPSPTVTAPPRQPPASDAPAVTDAPPVAESAASSAAIAVPPRATGQQAQFMAAFDESSDFYDRFDYGFSGQDPASNHNPDRLVSWTGDHDDGCGAPTSLRTIDIDRDTDVLDGGSYGDFDDMFWWCRGHMMTAVSTVGYSIAWFSPKPMFTDISRVCWDVNVTQMSTREWTQVLFVSEADATQHSSDRGSGGFDLGYTNPIFRDQPGSPSTGILPSAGDLAGLQVIQGGFFQWFENQTQWTTDLNSSQPIRGYFDKAARYQHCIEQISPGTVRFTQERPDTHGGFQQVDVPGTIPRGQVKVVFQDDNYNGPKGEDYDADVNTWHWDNIIIE